MTELLGAEAPVVVGSSPCPPGTRNVCPAARTPRIWPGDYEHDALSGVGGGLDAPETGGAGSNDARLKRDVPPHWG